MPHAQLHERLAWLDMMMPATAEKRQGTAIVGLSATPFHSGLTIGFDAPNIDMVLIARQVFRPRPLHENRWRLLCVVLGTEAPSLTTSEASKTAIPILLSRQFRRLDANDIDNLQPRLPDGI